MKEQPYCSLYTPIYIPTYDKPLHNHIHSTSKWCFLFKSTCNAALTLSSRTIDRKESVGYEKERKASNNMIQRQQVR